MKSGLTWAIAIGAVAFLLNPVPRDLWIPDEPTHAIVAQEIGQHPLGLVPRLNNTPYADYGPTYFWFVYLSGVLFGTSEPRYAYIPSGLACLAAALLVWRIGKALRPALLFAGSMGLLWESRSLLIDILLVPLSLLASYSFYRYAIEERRWRHLAAAFGWGLAAWSVKGPIGFVLPVAGAVLFLMVERRWREAAMLSIYSALAGLACAGLWYGTIALSEGAEMSRYVFHCQVLVRLFSGPATEHQEAAYFFIPYVFVFFAPWIFLLLPGIGCGVRHWRTLPPATRYWGIVALSILLVFSIPSCKRFYYIVPMVAPLSLFVSGCMESLGDLPGSRRLLAAQGGVLLVAAAFLMFGIIPDESMGAMFPTVLALALAGGIAMMAIALWSPTERIVPSVAGLAIAGYLAFTVFGLPALNENKSTRLFVQRARALAGPDARLVSFHGPGYALQYEDRSIQSVAELDQMRELLRQGTVYCFVKDIRLAWLKDLSCRPHILLSRNPPFERGELFLRLDPPNR